MSKSSRLFPVLLAGTLFLSTIQAATDSSLKVHYSFQSLRGGLVPDLSGNGFDGTLYNDAQVGSTDSIGFLDLGSSNGYFDLGTAIGELISTLGDFTVSNYLYIDPSTTITGDGNFLWAFSTSNACSQYSGKYIAYRVNAQRYAQSTGGYANEKVAISYGSAATKGVWSHVCYTQSGTTGTLYVNGVVLKTGTAGYKPMDIGTATTYNWIGRSPFSGDAYLKGASISDFRIYNRALTDIEVSSMYSNMGSVVKASNKRAMHAVADTFQLYGTDAVRTDMDLPQALNSNVQIDWTSSDPSVISSLGFVNRPASGSTSKTVTLTAIFRCGTDSIVKSFQATVLPYGTDAERVTSDLAALDFGTRNITALRSNLELPEKGAEGSVFSWTSSETAYMTSSGEILKRPAKGEGTKTLTLEVSARNGSVTLTRDISIGILEDEGFSSYLFAYFTGNSGTQEAIRFALSADGKNFKALNSNNPVISSDTIAQMKAVRDPHIYRGPDNNFYMVVTDMKSANGWSSNHAMVLLKSSDLVNWTHTVVDIAAVFPAFSTVNRVWAPQTIWDPAVGKFMIYWSMRSGSDPDVIYYSYTNADFTALTATPKVLFDYPTSTIDGDIIYKDDVYYLFFKTEGSGNGIKKAVSTSLTGVYTVKEDKYLQQTTSAVEGACVYRFINSDTHVLMYDVYTSGLYEFTTSMDLSNFKVMSDVSLNFAPRHGTVIPITTDEARQLTAKWGAASDMPVTSSVASAVKIINVVVDETAHTLYLPVKPGTNLNAFDPLLNTLPGVVITPSGPQDFSQGSIPYKLQLNDTVVNYTVSVAVNRNPVLEGYYADPEILYSEKTAKFYLYPTSDGFAGWSGTYFKCFSSDDLETWKDEGTILDLAGGDVAWASTNAWAPCIVEKKINGEFRYFYYFCANKQIGVAVSYNPNGPFVATGKALINTKPDGVTSGQEIDPDVFTDPATGKSYLYWGNGYMAGVELNDDMISIKTETRKVMTPNSTFREGVYVICRNGVYYFMWSENDTGSADYRVRYATSDGPLGSLAIPASNFVIKRDDTKAIYGTGHHSVVQIPGKDEWYIVYHRLTRPKGITLSSPGYYREVCIDKLLFNADGSIQQAQPTLEGVGAVTLPVGVKTLQIQKKKAEVSVYPNPVGNVLNIAVTDGLTEVSVFDVSGIRVLRIHLSGQNSRVDCSGLAPGYYLIEARNAESKLLGRFIKS
jgi:hypothetical protein